jgi:hypothetical protein
MTSDPDDFRPAATSRRRLLQAGAVTLGAGLLGVHGAAPGWAGAPTSPIGVGVDGTSAGADGAPPPPGTAPKRTLDANALPSDPTSYNGWTVGTPASAIGVQNYTVPGTNVVLPIRSGDVATVLLYVAQRFNNEVETLDRSQCWGYDYRPNVNNPSVWSNHASGTAIDLNAVNHPNGVSGTFTATQTAAVRQILAFCGNVVYWGEDYRGTVDGMHFEINVPPGSAELTALVRRIGGGFSDPIGVLDAVTFQGGTSVRVQGWAFDPDQPATAISIAIYVDGVGVGWFPTGRSRPDVNSAYKISGQHGFDVPLKLAAGSPHTVTVYAINVAGGTNNPVIGTGTASMGLNPVGSFDAATPLNKSVRLTGWAYDPDDPNAEISVALYRDGIGIGWFPTGLSRPDVNQVMGVPGDHGFDFTVDSPTGAHTFVLYAINVDGGTGNPVIGSKQVVVGQVPIGYLDGVSAAGGTVRIVGWAVDFDQPNTEISVAVYRNGGGVGWFPTGAPRPDVDAAFGVRGNHGFDISLPNVPAGDQYFDVYAINVGPDGGNPLIGSGHVQV